MSAQPHDGGRVIEIYPSTTYNFTSGEFKAVWALQIQKEGKGLGDRNKDYLMSFDDAEAAARYLVEWYAKGAA